jgi:hypothetical protein
LRSGSGGPWKRWQGSLKSHYTAAARNRAEVKAIYALIGNEKFNRNEILAAHRAAVIRHMAGHPVILAVKDTTPVNYDSQQEMEGNGYIDDRTMGVNIHSCLAVTPEGLVLGMLDQMGFNRAERKNAALTREQQKNRPIEEKESARWLATMEHADSGISDEIKVIHVCDREGDIYELFDMAIQSGRHFLIRIAQNRMSVENGQILDKIRETDCKGRIKAKIPRDSRNSVKEREAVLQMRYARYEIKKPEIKNRNTALPLSLPVTVIHVKEEQPPDGVEAIAWFLMTTGEVNSAEDAYQNVENYLQRWKTERFHHVLKSGCKIEKLQERSMEKTKTLIMMYSVIAVFIMDTCKYLIFRNSLYNKEL